MFRRCHLLVEKLEMRLQFFVLQHLSESRGPKERAVVVLTEIFNMDSST
jgi:hypothetical protein